MALAADAIDDDARDLEPRVIARAALDDRRRRLRLARHVEDEQDRHAERRRDVGRGAAAPACRRERRRRGPSRLRRTRARMSRRLRGERGQKARRHRPGIEIDALATRRRGMKGRIDIVGAGLQAHHFDAAPPERAQEAERRRRLAAARARRGDHQAAGRRARRWDRRCPPPRPRRNRVGKPMQSCAPGLAAGEP